MKKYSQEYVNTITKQVIAEVRKKEKVERITRQVLSSHKEAKSIKILDKIKKFIKIPSKAEAKKIIQDSSDKEIQDAYKYLPQVLKGEDGVKESFSLSDLKKKAILLAAIAVLGGGMLTGCGKTDSPPAKADILKYYEMDLEEEDFEPAKLVFEYTYSPEEGFYIHYTFKLDNNYLTYAKDPTFTVRDWKKGDIPEEDYKEIALEGRDEIAKEMIPVKDIFERSNAESIDTFVKSSKSLGQGATFKMLELDFYYKSPVSGKEFKMTIEDGTLKKNSGMSDFEYNSIWHSLNWGGTIGSPGSREEGFITRTGLVSGGVSYQK